MKPTWYRISATLFNDTQEPGTVTVFFDYDIRVWVVGIRFDPDPSWYSLHFELGPISISFDYWRRYVSMLS